MKAIVVSQPGGPEVLQYQEVPTPKVKPGWSLVKVKGFGINHSEIFTREGKSPSVKFPRILGIEAVGEVAETSDPTRFRVGQPVAAIMGEMGRAFDGGYAEYALLPNQHIFPVETSLSWEELAAVPETYYTAYGIVKGLQVKPNDRILVRAATSGIGLASLKLIRALNRHNEVVGTTRSPEKRAQLIQAGFDGALVVAAEIPVDEKFDKIVELVGPLTLRDSMQHLSPYGIVNMTGELGNQWTLPEFDPITDMPNDTYVTGFSSADVTSGKFQEMLDFVTTHHIDVAPEKVFSLEETKLAHEYLASRQSFGKVVVMTGL